MIYLTFDDGPHPEITARAMEILSRYQAAATFFCVGENAARYPEVMDELRQRGHRIGNHTYNHIKGWNAEIGEYLNNVSLAGPYTSEELFRPPYGRIRKKQGKALMESGYRIVMWSLLSCDYVRDLNKARTLKIMTESTGPGSIVVFHDSAKAGDNMLWLLPKYLEAMSARGFTFEAL